MPGIGRRLVRLGRGPQAAAPAVWVDVMVLSLSAKGVTTGEIAAICEDTYGQAMSKDPISRITDKVTEWLNPPLDPVPDIPPPKGRDREWALHNRVGQWFESAGFEE